MKDPTRQIPKTREQYRGKPKSHARPRVKEIAGPTVKQMIGKTDIDDLIRFLDGKGLINVRPLPPIRKSEKEKVEERIHRERAIMRMKVPEDLYEEMRAEVGDEVSYVEVVELLIEADVLEDPFSFDLRAFLGPLA